MKVQEEKLILYIRGLPMEIQIPLQQYPEGQLLHLTTDIKRLKQQGPQQTTDALRMETIPIHQVTVLKEIPETNLTAIIIM